MLNITSHSLARKLLALPDLPVVIDGIGEEVGIACMPQIGWTNGGKADKSDEVIVIEIVTKKREDKEEENRQLEEENQNIQQEAGGRGVYWDKGNSIE